MRRPLRLFLLPSPDVAEEHLHLHPQHLRSEGRKRGGRRIGVRVRGVARCGGASCDRALYLASPSPPRFLQAQPSPSTSKACRPTNMTQAYDSVKHAA